MNPILHDLQNKQWVWTAAHAKQKTPKQTLATGFDTLDNVLSGGFPRAGTIHVQSYLGCGEMRLILSLLSNISKDTDTGADFSHKLFVFIDPPFELNAEFLLSHFLLKHKISLEQLVVLNSKNTQEALWSAEQCAKSGACHSIFLWQKALKSIQVRKLEHASVQGDAYCFWMQSILEQDSQLKEVHSSNLPLSLSLSITRYEDDLQIKINKQKVGWAQNPVKIPFPFICRTNRWLKKQSQNSIHNNVLSIKRNLVNSQNR